MAGFPVAGMRGELVTVHERVFRDGPSGCVLHSARLVCYRACWVDMHRQKVPGSLLHDFLCCRKLDTFGKPQVCRAAKGCCSRP